MPAEDMIEIQVQLIPEQHPPDTGISIHQPSVSLSTRHIPVEIFPAVDKHSASKQCVDSQTQSLSWTELTLEMLADIVSQQVIRVTQLEELSVNRGVPCYHMTGIKWKDFLDMIIHTHNATCFQHTGVMFNHNAVKIGVMLESSGVEQGMKSIYTGGRTSVGVQTDPVEETFVSKVKMKEENVDLMTLSSSRKINERVDHQTNKEKEDMNDVDGVVSFDDNFDAGERVEENEMQRSKGQLDSTEKENTFGVDVPIKGYPAQCHICKKRFRSKTMLNRHVVIHEPGRNQHPCTYCDKVCKTKCYLERHMATHLKPEKQRKRKPYKRKCNQGQVVSEEKNGAQVTKGDQVKKKDPATCSICQKTFTIARNLKRHEKIHLKEDKFPCTHCDKICKSAHYLQRHMMVHAEEKQYKCADCGISFGQKHKLKQHRSKAHNKYEEHKCDVCGNVYKNRETLQDHMILHTGKKSYLCETCGKTFNRPSIYRLHLSYHASRSDPEAHKCTLCPKAYHSRSLLNKHVRYAHLKERNNRCNVCGSGFFTKQQLTSHEQVHREKSTHVCTFCGKGFSQKHTLLAHRRIHTGYRPFLCRYCSKGFTSKGLLVKHEKIHTTLVKPDPSFQCKECHATFRNKTAWSDHEKRHAGIKDHKCEFCHVAFVTRGDLTRHLRTHTGGKPFKCQHCEERFQKKLELTEHEVAHGFVEVPITVTLIPEQK